MGALFALAVADFRDRVRRPAFGMTLLATLVFAYLAAPPAEAGYALMQVGDFRGTYNSAYVGTLLAVMTGGWLAVAGFYVVKNTVSRDEQTGVGQILAATPLTSRTYLFGKFLSNFLVLASMAGVVAVMAVVTLWVRGEASSLDLVALWTPFLLFPVSLITLVAGAAVLFEAVPRLRGGFGNLVWGVAASMLTIASQVLMRFAPGLGFDPLGLTAVSDAMRQDVQAQHPGAEDVYLVIGLVTRSEQPERFTWTSGLDIDAGLLLQPLVLITLGLAFALVPALWFARFDTARRRPAAAPVGPVDGAASVAAGADAPAAGAGAGARGAGAPGAGAPGAGAPAADAGGGPGPDADRHPESVRAMTPAQRGWPFGRLVIGELRVLLSRTPRVWTIGVLGLIVAGAVVPLLAATTILLAVAWLWPVLILSRVGTQQCEHELTPIVASTPAPLRRLLAEWTTALLVTVVVGIGPLIRLLSIGDNAGAAAWMGGAVFIPTLALALGSLSRSPRTFQAVYLLLWIVVFTGERHLDFMGVQRVDGVPAGPAPVVVLGVAAVLELTVLVVQYLRHVRR
ncbi:hypothetical protein [Cryptosporangium aurantiacum]|uniref:ABC-2 family transporter protein n=1 Tax=Cryptosporangium aurantiacum TaxID=134849 RepID=A0A1M7RLJ7_9ACTN|nr:hypothetical protein [Cryptosporangium aurantiacum]SHN47185.1 hypothetical protein SAMN05443668_12133 [Cryptosporangium aurantiacum]